MNRVLFFILYSLLPLFIIAQGTEVQPKVVKKKNMAFEFNAGYNLPLGKYQSVDGSDKKSGYAGSGWMAQVTFDWMGSHNIGLAIQYTFQKNSYQDAAKTVSPIGVHDSSFFLGPGSWSNNYLMFGPVFIKSFGKIEVDAKLLLGIIFASGTTFTTTNASNKQNDANIGTGFAYGISAGVGYKCSDQVTLNFNLNLLGGWPGKSKEYSSQIIGYEVYKDPATGIAYQKPVYSAPVEYSIKKVITTLNPSIGLTYHF